MLCAATALALVVGCGGDGNGDGGTGDELEAAIEEAAKEAASNPEAAVTGFEAEPPAKVRKCLEQQGLTVSSDSSIPEELKETSGITDQLTIISDASGAGSITWFETEEEAIAAHEAEPHAVARARHRRDAEGLRGPLG